MKESLAVAVKYAVRAAGVVGAIVGAEILTQGERPQIVEAYVDRQPTAETLEDLETQYEAVRDRLLAGEKISASFRVANLSPELEHEDGSNYKEVSHFLGRSSQGKVVKMMS